MAARRARHHHAARARPRRSPAPSPTPAASSSCRRSPGWARPHWDPDARGLIIGITRGTTRAHLVRATLEAIAFEVRDVVDVMTARRRHRAPGAVRRRRGGGQRPALPAAGDQLQVPVRRPQVAETTALGAAFLAGLATGVWSSTDELADTWRLDRRFEPGARDDAGYAPLAGRGRPCDERVEALARGRRRRRPAPSTSSAAYRPAIVTTVPPSERRRAGPARAGSATAAPAAATATNDDHTRPAQAELRPGQGADDERGHRGGDRQTRTSRSGLAGTTCMGGEERMTKIMDRRSS